MHDQNMINSVLIIPASWSIGYYGKQGHASDRFTSVRTIHGVSDVGQQNVGHLIG